VAHSNLLLRMLNQAGNIASFSRDIACNDIPESGLFIWAHSIVPMPAHYQIDDRLWTAKVEYESAYTNIETIDPHLTWYTVPDTIIIDISVHQFSNECIPCEDLLEDSLSRYGHGALEFISDIKRCDEKDGECYYSQQQNYLVWLLLPL
jgi:hypothetical protein